MLDGEAVLPLQVHDEDADLPVTAGRLLYGQVQQDRGILAPGEGNIDPGEVVEDVADPLPGGGQDVYA